MPRNLKKVSAGGVIVFLFALLNAIVLEQGYISHTKWYKLAYVTLPLLLISLVALRRKPL
jgi:uncharacterized membrane protein YhdT